MSVFRFFKIVQMLPNGAKHHILHCQRTPKNFWFSGVFRGYKVVTLALNRLILTSRTVQLYPYSPLMVHLKMMS